MYRYLFRHKHVHKTMGVPVVSVIVLHTFLVFSVAHVVEHRENGIVHASEGYLTYFHGVQPQAQVV